MAAEFDIRKTVDNVGQLLARVATLTASDILVGVPEDKTGRSDGTINNATLAYIHEFGSPAKNIPARPFLFPGVRKARPQVIAVMRQGAKDAMQGKGTVDATLNKAGMIARNAVIEAITDPVPPFVPLQAATIRARLRRTQAGRRQIRKAQKQALLDGTSTAAVLSNWGAAGNIKPLIDTGALRASISYVVDKR
jgi:hypothetical protein